MVGQVYSVRRIIIVVILVGFISSSYCINSGLIAEMKHLKPMLFKKYSQNPPVFINEKSEGRHVTGALVHKIKANLPPMKSMKLTERFSRSIWPVPNLPLVPHVLPLIPQMPILPLFPNWLPQPIGSVFPVKQSRLLKLSQLLRWSNRKAQIHEKLLELKHKSSLTPAEYIRFQKLLLKY